MRSTPTVASLRLPGYHSPHVGKSGAFMQSSSLIPYIFVVATFALMAVIITVNLHYARKRTRELTEVAQQIGLRFVGKDWRGPSLSSQPKITLLQRTHGTYSNVMTGEPGGLQVSLCDYTYPAGKASATQTLAIFLQALPLPFFALRPENFLDKIGDTLFHNDLDFDSHPEFSKRYLLRSPDEANTRALFTPDLLTYLEQLQTNWHIEAAGTTLILYLGSPLDPSDVRSFLDEASRIARTVFASEGLRKPPA
jgi:hypothetical protein